MSEPGSHTAGTKGERPFRKISVGVAFTVVLSLLLVAAATWLLDRYEEQKKLVSLGYQRALLSSADQTQKILERTLIGFRQQISSAPLNEMLSRTVQSEDSTAVVEERSIESNDGTEASEGSGNCPLKLSNGRLSYNFSGLAQNSGNTWENLSINLSADLVRQIQDKVPEKPFQALLVIKQTGESLLPLGESRVSPTPRQIAEWIEETGGSKNLAGMPRDELKVAGQSYTVFHREVPLWSLPEAKNLPGFNSSCSEHESLHVLGLVADEQIQQDSLELPQGSLIVLCFALFLIVLSFPFLKLFFAPEERFRRIDAFLLLLCGALLVSTVLFSGIFGASLSSLGKEDDTLLEELAETIRHPLAEKLGALETRLPAPYSDCLALGKPAGGKFPYDCKHAVGWMADHLRSHEPMILPTGFGFILTNEQDRVVYASEMPNAAFSRIKDEAGVDQELKSALASGSRVSFTTTFPGLLQRMLIKEFPGREGWNLMVYRDLEPFRSIRFYTSLTTLVAVTAYLFFLAGLGVLSGRLLNRQLHLDSIWPHLGRGALYLQLAAAYLVLGALSLLVISRLAPGAAILLAALVPALALLTTLWSLAPKPDLIAPSLRPAAWSFALIVLCILGWAGFQAVRYAWWNIFPILMAVLLPALAFRLAERTIPRRYGQPLYSVVIVCFLLLCAGLPTWTVYRAAFQQEEFLLETYIQRQVLKAHEKNKDKKASLVLRQLVLRQLPKRTRLSTDTDLFAAGYAALRILENDYTISTAGYLKTPVCWTNFDLVRCPPSSTVPSLEGRLPTLLPTDWGERILWLAMLFLGLASALALSSLSVRRLFGGEVPAGRFEPKQLQPSRALWVAPRSHWLDKLAALPAVKTLTLAEVDNLPAETFAEWSADPNVATLLVKDFGEVWPAVGDADQRLKLVQKLLECWRKGIWLASEVSLENLAADGDPQGKNLRDLLFGTNFQLLHPAFGERALRARADADPETIWRTLTPEEQRACRQVAHAGYFRLGDTASSLAYYGLLDMDSVPRLVSRIFQAFVLRKPGAGAPGWTEAGSAGNWGMVRWVLLFGLTVFLSFLFFTQEESFKALSTAITCVGVVLGGMWQIGGYLWPAKSGSSS